MNKTNKLKSFTLDEDTAQSLKEIAQTTKIGSESAAVRLCISFFSKNYDVIDHLHQELKHKNKEIILLKKYMNEQRRMSFKILDLLNMICMNENIHPTPSHRDKDFKSSALLQAEENLSEYLKEIAVRNKYGDFTLEDDDTDESSR